MAASIEYISTRGLDQSVPYTDAIRANTAPDGGLFVPRTHPEIYLTDLFSLAGRPYHERAAFLIKKFGPNLDPGAIEEDCVKAYGEQFDDPKIVPLVHLKGKQYMAQQWHGPTKAFKDLGMQYMSNAFSRVILLDNEEREARGEFPLDYIIQATTTGDTGVSAAAAFQNRPHTAVLVYYPDGRVSAMQKLQMRTQEGANITVFGMRNIFDVINKAVVSVFDDKEFGASLKEKNIALSSANSINWGRLLPQIAYHIHAYVELMEQGIIDPGDKIDIAVPTGNFGNILAAFYAKEMGLPIGKLICASNANDVVTEFLQTGIYDTGDGTLAKTPSPSMDILRSKNVERLLFLITGDSSKVRQWMYELDTYGRFEVDEKTRDRLRDEFYAGSVSNKETLDNIGRIVDETGYLMDPHTSVAQSVAEKYEQESFSENTIVICSTAHWAKFPIDVLSGLVGGEGDIHFRPQDEWRAIDEILRRVPEASVPQSIVDLFGKPILHGTIFDATVEDVKRSIAAHLEKMWLQERARHIEAIA